MPPAARVPGRPRLEVIGGKAWLEVCRRLASQAPPALRTTYTFMMFVGYQDGSFQARPPRRGGALRAEAAVGRATRGAEMDVSGERRVRRIG